MAFRLRRGTDAERQGITPLEGELIYTTDTKNLFVGDGTTIGGNLATVASLDDLDNVNIGADSTVPSDGDLLAYNAGANEWRPVAAGAGGGATTIAALTDVDLTGVADGNVLTYDSASGNFVVSTNFITSIDFDDVTNTPTTLQDYGITGGSLSANLALGNNDITGVNTIGVTIGNIGTVNSGLINSDTIVSNYVDGNLIGSVYADDSSLIIDGATGNITAPNITGALFGNVTGDVTGNVTGNVTGSTKGDLLANDNTKIFDANTQIISTTLNGNVISSDTVTILVDHNTNTFNGTLIGDVTGYVVGDLSGSVFASDSSTMVDALSIELSALKLTVDEVVSKNGTGEINLVDDTKIDLSFIKTSTGDISSSVLDRGRLSFYRDDVNGKVKEAIFGGGYGGIYGMIDDGTTTFPEAGFFGMISNLNFGIATFTPSEKLEVNGNAKVSGFVQFGSLTSTERDNLTAANGMVIYNSTNNKFEGYQNGGWINLDDGLAAS